MLPKTSRITTSRFSEIVKIGKNLGFGPFYLKTLPNTEARFAVAIPKKLIKGAIKRHFLKRRVFNALKSSKNLFPNGDFIIFANKEAIDMSFEDIKNKLEEIAKKVATNY